MPGSRLLGRDVCLLAADSGRRRRGARLERIADVACVYSKPPHADDKGRGDPEHSKRSRRRRVN